MKQHVQGEYFKKSYDGRQASPGKNSDGCFFYGKHFLGGYFPDGIYPGLKIRQGNVLGKRRWGSQSL